MPGSTGVATPGILITLSFMDIACFGSTLHMKGTHAVLDDKFFLAFV